MKLRFATLAVLPMALSLAACNKASLDGKWDVSGMQQGPVTPKVTMEFTGAKFVMNMVIEQAPIKLTVTADGSYKVEGDKLTLTTENVKVDDSQVPAQMKALIGGQIKPDVIKNQMNQDKVATLKFTDKDTATLAGTKQTLTLTRAKA